MGFFDKLLGKNTATSKPMPEPPLAKPDPSQNKDLIRVVDDHGRELFITRSDFRDNLLGNVKKAWDDPDRLYALIVMAKSDGFFSDVLDAAKRLHEIDEDKARSACVWGGALTQERRLDEAEAVFRDFVSRHGENSFVSSNLARVYCLRGDEATAEQILWRALEVDPNHDDNSIWLYEATVGRLRPGAETRQDILRRIAALSGSWRAQLWLAYYALDAGQFEEALAHYKESLAHAGKPVPGSLLEQMSGDLGKHGRIADLLALTEPHYDASVHGFRPAQNLIKAHLELGHVDGALSLCKQLRSVNRPDWAPALREIENQIASVRSAPA
jgi:tetratricopeptide (TPR) repeat protein